MVKLLLLILGSAKFGKLLVTGGSMLLSIAVYAWIFGWWFAVGFVVLLFLHEMGHFIAARQRGLNVGLPTFIPFVGAWVELKDLPHNAETEAYVGLAGPLAGTVASLACYYASRVTGSDLLLALSYSGFFLNLFNLIPLSPFDGGRVCAVISPKLWLVGAPILIGWSIYHPSPIAIIMVILAAPQVWSVLTGKAGGRDASYYVAEPSTRVVYGAMYLGLVLFLAVITGQVHDSLAHVHSRGFS